MNQGESLEETAKRKTYEETGLTVENLELSDVFSDKEFHLKLRNQDELNIGQLQCDLHETLNLRVFDDEISESLGYNYRRFLECYPIKK